MAVITEDHWPSLSLANNSQTGCLIGVEYGVGLNNLLNWKGDDGEEDLADLDCTGESTSTDVRELLKTAISTRAFDI